MSGKLWVYSGTRPSNGAKVLASEDEFLRLRPERFHRVKQNDVIINWGVSDMAFLNTKVLNVSQNVRTATNKLAAFIGMDSGGIKTVEWSEDRNEAQEWAKDGKTIVARTKLTGHSGDGIVIIDPENTSVEDIPYAPLYTKYVFKVKEFRVHVVNGKVIDTQQKIKDPDREVKTWKVRSHENGFIFARNSIVPNSTRDELATAAISSLGLDFGAVDIIEDKKGNLYVLEVNTAPGLEGQTVQSYANAFRGYANGN